MASAAAKEERTKAGAAHGAGELGALGRVQADRLRDFLQRDISWWTERQKLPLQTGVIAAALLELQQSIAETKEGNQSGE